MLGVMLMTPNFLLSRRDDGKVGNAMEFRGTLEEFIRRSATECHGCVSPWDKSHGYHRFLAPREWEMVAILALRGFRRPAERRGVGSHSRARVMITPYVPALAGRHRSLQTAISATVSTFPNTAAAGMVAPGIIAAP